MTDDRHGEGRGGVSGRILLVRHGQTPGNGRCYVGRTDLPLDTVGVEQAQGVAALLADERLDAIYSSPLLRAQATARPLAEQHRVPIRISPALTEIDYGTLAGLSKADHRLYLRRDHRHIPLPSGESLYDVYCRACTALDELRSDLDAGRNVAIVGHFWSNRMLVGALSGQPFAEIVARSGYKPANGSVFRLRYRASVSQGLAILSMADLEHRTQEASVQ